jgi:hypothetical protein
MLKARLEAMTRPRFVPDLFSDPAVKRKLTDWAAAIANSGDREGAMRVCAGASADFIATITLAMLAALDQQRQIDESFPL